MSSAFPQSAHPRPTHPRPTHPRPIQPKPHRALLFGIGSAFGIIASTAAAAQALQSYNAPIQQTSVSGISSGAYMAVQFATAWSSIIQGVGAVAGGPFGCSGGSGSAALSSCMGGQPPIDLSVLISRTDALSATGQIDDINGLAKEKVYLFNGYNDSVVNRKVSNALYAFYARYMPSSTENIFYQTAVGAGHAQVTLGYGGKCSANGGEFINRCDYDQAGIILQHIYGALQARNSGASTGQMLAFRQADFTQPDQPGDDSMGDSGFVYVPSSCAAREACRLHIALHGCEQSFTNIGQDFVQHAGYNEWADSNHIIVLYPQTSSSFVNPQSCWDWWGYLDHNPTEQPTFLLKSGKQISAIKAMIDRITSGASAGTDAAPPTATASDATAMTIRALDCSDIAIDIAWSAVSGATSYDVLRASPANVTFQKIGTTTGLSYADAGLMPGTQYRYKVTPSSGGVSSDIVTQTTLRRVPPCIDPGTCATR